jgi:hypothetical protein
MWQIRHFCSTELIHIFLNIPCKVLVDLYKPHEKAQCSRNALFPTLQTIIQLLNIRRAFLGRYIKGTGCWHWSMIRGWGTTCVQFLTLKVSICIDNHPWSLPNIVVQWQRVCLLTLEPGFESRWLWKKDVFLIVAYLFTERLGRTDPQTYTCTLYNLYSRCQTVSKKSPVQW